MKLLVFPANKERLQGMHKMMSAFVTDDTVFYLMRLEHDTWQEFLNVKDIRRKHFLIALYRYSLTATQDSDIVSQRLAKASANYSVAHELAAHWSEFSEKMHIEAIADVLPAMKPEQLLIQYRQSPTSCYIDQLNLEYLLGEYGPAALTAAPLIRKFYDTYNPT